MTIGLIYAMRGEIESLLNTENAEPLQSAAGVEFYQIRPNVIACIGGQPRHGNGASHLAVSS